MKITVYKDVYDKTSQNYISVGRVLYFIKSGRWAEKIHRLRQATEKSDRAKIKTLCRQFALAEHLKAGMMQKL